MQLYTSRQEVPIEQSETSVENRKITFLPPSTSSNIHQPTEHQLVAMFPEHLPWTIQQCFGKAMCRGLHMILHHHHSSAKAKRKYILQVSPTYIVNEDDELEMFHSVIGYYKYQI